MAVQQVGPLFYVDGPPPRAPRYTLVGAADINPETDEHWANGIQVHGYVPDVACRWSSECDFDERPAKNPQQNPNPLPEFGPLTVYLAETCSVKSIMQGSQEESDAAFRQRARDVFAAVESGALERELWGGDFLPDNPHLTSSFGEILNGDAATSALNGLALLEEAIADTNRAGVIHMTAGMAVTLSGYGNGVLIPERGKLYTINGTLVIPAYGYTGAAPDGAPDVTGSEEFAYATGPVEILRSGDFIMPPNLVEAIDREQNEITYRAERYYIAYWDTALLAGVRIDRCFASCDGS